METTPQETINQAIPEAVERDAQGIADIYRALPHQERERLYAAALEAQKRAADPGGPEAYHFDPLQFFSMFLCAMSDSLTALNIMEARKSARALLGITAKEESRLLYAFETIVSIDALVLARMYRWNTEQRAQATQATVTTGGGK